MDAKLNILLQKYYSKIPEKNLFSKIDYYLIESILKDSNKKPEDIRSYIINKLSLKYLEYDKFLDHMRYLRLTNPERRQRIVNEIKSTGQKVINFLENADLINFYEQYLEVKKAITPRSTYIFSKAVLIYVLNKMHNNEDTSLKDGLLDIVKKTDLKNCSYLLKDFINTIADINGVKRKDDEEKDDLKTALDISKQEIESLKEEIEEIRGGQKKEAIISFLRDLNSSQNGNLLDQFSISAETIKKLKKEKFEFPSQLASIPTNIRMFMKFINNLGVKPISRIGYQFKVNLEFSQDYDYLGTPFKDSEKKLVKVLTPGWKFEEQIISKPQIKEIIKEEIKKG